MLEKQGKKQRRHKRVRAKIIGTAKRPRICVFRSNKHIYAQLIDDNKGRTILSSNDIKLKDSKNKSKKPAEKNKSEQKEKPLSGKCYLAFLAGRQIAEKAIEKKITKAVFDRGGYKYHGRVKSLAQGARDKGLKF